MVQGNGPHAGTASEIREDILLGVRVLSTGVTLWLLGGGREIEDERKTSCKESQVAGFVLPDPPSTPFTLSLPWEAWELLGGDQRVRPAESLPLPCGPAYGCSHYSTKGC